MSVFERTRLGEVAEFVMGQAPPSAYCNTSGTGTVFVKAGEFGERFRAVLCRAIHAAEASHVHAERLHYGDIQIG